MSAPNVAAIATTGDIGKPLITVAGTMDALLPINLHARAYARAVAAAICRAGYDPGDGQHRRPAYRLYEVQNGNHIETSRDTFPQLELIQPHAQHAFDLLVDHVEQGVESAAGPVHSARRLDRGLADPAGALRRSIRPEP